MTGNRQLQAHANLRCIVSPGLVELRANRDFMLGGYSVDFRATKDLSARPECSLCVTANIVPDRLLQQGALENDVHCYFTSGAIGQDSVLWERKFRGLPAARLRLKGLATHKPLVEVNNAYRDLLRVRTNLLYPFGTFVQDVLATQLLSSGMAAVHGAAFASGGKGALILGLPGVGKSTVLFDALAKGFDFLTEDMMLVDSQGYVHACPGVSSFAYDLRRTSARRNFGTREFLSNQVKSALAHTPAAWFLTWPYMDITQALPRVSRVDRARPAVIFIVARGKEEKIVELRAEDAGRMVAAINRHTFAYTENTILQEYTLLNPSLSLSELLFREEDLLRGIVDRSENYLCTAPDPHGFFPLMEPAVR